MAWSDGAEELKCDNCFLQSERIGLACGRTSKLFERPKSLTGARARTLKARVASASRHPRIDSSEFLACQHTQTEYSVAVSIIIP